MNIRRALASNVWLWTIFCCQFASAYTAIPRWGQAIAIVQNTLWVYGGKTDPTNSYSYDSAPPTNDLLSLSLQSSFDPSNAPWQLVNSSTTPSTLAWHTMSPTSNTTVIVFGGDPGPNSAPPLRNLADSANIIELQNPNSPDWSSQTIAWAGEPIRRIYHTFTSSVGKAWLIGGQKDDGSGNAISENYLFDPSGPQFIQMPAGGPTGVFGHSSVLLSDGRLIVLGGQSTNGLNPLSIIWTLNTTDTTLTWTSVSASVSSGSLPTPRRAFAAAVIPNGMVIIHGGGDSASQTYFSDGWVLDTNTNPMVWSPVPALSQLGSRRDHFAAVVGSQIIYGFGFTSSGGASATLSIFDSSTGSFSSSFNPPSVSPSSVTVNGETTFVPSSTSQSPSPQPTAITNNPSSDASNPLSTASTPSPPTINGSSGGGGTSTGGGRAGRTTAIAVGTTIGLLGLVAGGIAAAYYLRKRRNYPSSAHFYAMGYSDEDEERGGGMGSALAMGEKSRGKWAVASKRHRQDFLADEDTRQFIPKRENSGDSGWSLIAAGNTAVKLLRGNKAASEMSDPFTDSNELGSSHERKSSFYPNDLASYIGSNGSLDGSQRSRAGSLFSEVPPSTVDHLTGANVVEPMIDSHPPLTASAATEGVLGASVAGVGAKINSVSGSDSSHTAASAIKASSQVSHSSASGSRPTIESMPLAASAKPLGRSDTFISSGQPLGRTDSWWQRLSRSPLLERRGSTSLSAAPLAFRDPNPAPRTLGAIREGSAASRGSLPDKIYQKPKSGKSTSSFQTNKTANSAAIERAGGMDIVQRFGSGSTRRSATADTLESDYTISESGECPDDSTTVASNDSVDGATELATPISPSTSRQRVVFERVKAYERRFSTDVANAAMSPKNTRVRDEIPSASRPNIKYGFAPKQPLFVANPERDT